MRLRVARKDFVIQAELVIDLNIEARAVRAIFGRRDQVRMRAELVNEARRGIGWRERVVREEVVCDGIKSVLGNHISREWVAGPGSIYLADRSGIIDSVADLRPCRIEKIEVPVQHVRAWDVADERF